MTKNKIIKEKLYDIDHNLDTEMLWGELEAKLPPVKESNRKPIFWFLGCLFGLMLAVSLLWNAEHESISLKESILLSAIDEDTKLSEANQYNRTIASNEKTELIESGTDHQINFEEISTVLSSERQQEEPFRKSTISNTKTQSHFEIKISEDLPNNIKAEQNNLIKRRRITITENTKAPSFQNENTNEKSTPKLTLTSKYLDAVKGNDKQAEYSNITVAYLPLTEQNVIFESEFRAKPQIAEFIFPTVSTKSKKSNWELGVYFVYGQTKSEDASLSFDRAINKTELGNSTSFDILGLDLQLRYNLHKNYGVYLGGALLRYTDEVNFTEAQTLNTSSLDLEGYSITENSYRINAYDTYDLFDVNVGGFYNLNIGKWNLRPSLGISHNIYNKSMQIDPSNPLQTPEGVNNQSYLVNQSETTYDYGLGYEAGLSFGYNFTRSISSEAGINYRSKRSITDIGQLNQSLVYKLGLNYRF